MNDFVPSMKLKNTIHKLHVSCLFNNGSAVGVKATKKGKLKFEDSDEEDLSEEEEDMEEEEMGNLSDEELDFEADEDFAKEFQEYDDDILDAEEEVSSSEGWYILDDG